jgi:hypothetical protein
MFVHPLARVAFLDTDSYDVLTAEIDVDEYGLLSSSSSLKYPQLSYIAGDAAVPPAPAVIGGTTTPLTDASLAALNASATPAKPSAQGHAGQGTPVNLTGSLNGSLNGSANGSVYGSAHGSANGTVATTSMANHQRDLDEADHLNVIKSMASTKLSYKVIYRDTSGNPLEDTYTNLSHLRDKINEISPHENVGGNKSKSGWSGTHLPRLIKTALTLNGIPTINGSNFRIELSKR